VAIRGGVIRAIRPSEALPPSVPQLDLGGRVVTSGFWNCHVHLTGGPWRASRTAGAAELQPVLDDMFLSRGFTQVLDLASNPLTTRALVRRITGGDLRDPEIVTAANGIRPWRGIPFYVADDLPRYLHPLMPGPLTPLGARLVVAVQSIAGAGLSKLFTGSYVTPTRVKTMRLAVARAAVSAARRRGMRVFAHPSNRAGTSVAIKAGVDALAHLPDETLGTETLLREAAARGIRIVPTLHMFASTVTTDEAYLAPIRDALSGFIGAGGHVLFGTDVGYMRDRDTRGEFVAMHAAGMDSSEILRSLTTEPARFMNRPDLGSVEPGKRANLTVLATTASPAPTDFADISYVIRDGRVVYERS
jgi:imidazolonepropionase-like amidohydrolase